MADERLARRYAQAIFQLAQEQNAVPIIGSNLEVVRDALSEDAVTKGFFLSPVIDRSEKEHVLRAAFEGKAHEVALHALLLLVRKRREPLLDEVVRQYGILQMQARGAEPLTIASARPLEARELQAVVAHLEAVYGKRFEVTQRVDPRLIGGLRITMGDRRIDGSVEGRLQELSRTLFARN